MKYWHEMGAPAHKLNVGFGAYGRVYNLTSASNHVGAPANTPGDEKGFWSYYQVGLNTSEFTSIPCVSFLTTCHMINICLFLQFVAFQPFLQTCHYLKEVTANMIPDQHVPYATKDHLWVGFDNQESRQTKVHVV